MRDGTPPTKPARTRRRRFELKKMMFVLPNLFTVSSIFCGFYAAVTAAGAVEGGTELYRACIAVLFAMVFDSVDGRVARMTRTQSEFGVQMDSLADVISFGAAPALIAWHWGLSAFGTYGLVVCFLFTACGTIRLARFNVMAAAHVGPSNYFVGLPIPAAAGLLVATIIAWLRSGNARLGGEEFWAPLLLVFLGLLMVSTIKFRTFKATRLTRRAFAVIMTVFGTLAVLAFQIGPAFAILALMGTYLAFGLTEESVRLVRRLARPVVESPGGAVAGLAPVDLGSLDPVDTLDEEVAEAEAAAAPPDVQDEEEEPLD